jgi:CDP-paratose 2-epimerase
MEILVTGSNGLIGTEVCEYFASEGHEIVGVDNNQRAEFFGEGGDTTWNRRRLKNEHSNYQHVDLDIRDREEVDRTLHEIGPDAIVHTAAQPSHDLAAQIPYDDFDVNAVGTLNLLESTRQHVPEAPFVHLSTNKVYGDAPNRLPLVELDTRWEFDDPEYKSGIPEGFTIDQSKHSLFGASKAAADLMVQEYGNYFGLQTCCLRGGCLTGPNHAGVELHGFLSYLVKCNLTEETYTIFGYKGKQVRDNIHSLDVAKFAHEFIKEPRCGEVYNIGGGKGNSCSILEAFEKVESITGKEMKHEYDEESREGDHICYYSDLSKAKSHYPDWDITVDLDEIFRQIVEGWDDRLPN